MLSKGLFDLQVNGYAGVDFNDPALTPADMDHALEALLADGVTVVLPTVITAPQDQLQQRLKALDAAVRDSVLGPTMVPGYHLEGPFLNETPGYRGCHPPEAMGNPQIDRIDALGEALFRPILLVTLAPERAGAGAVTKALVAQGKTVAIGHSAADFAQVAAAVDLGVSMSTHLGNGLPQDLPKLENTLLAQLAEHRLAACLIADGHHISPAALAALIALKRPENCILVSDAVVAAAAPAGTYRFAGMTVQAGADGRVEIPGQPGLAGSALRLDQAVRNLVDWRIAEPALAMRMASGHPHRALAHSLAHHGITVDPGQLKWSSALEPTIVRRGTIAA